MTSRSGEQSWRSDLYTQVTPTSHLLSRPVLASDWDDEGNGSPFTGAVLGHQDCHRLRAGALTAAVQRYESTTVGRLRVLPVITFLECCSGCVVTGYLGAHTLSCRIMSHAEHPTHFFSLQKSVHLLQVGPLMARSNFVEHVVVVQHFTFHQGNEVCMQQDAHLG
jgi:hypothetical protein